MYTSASFFLSSGVYPVEKPMFARQSQGYRPRHVSPAFSTNGCGISHQAPISNDPSAGSSITLVPRIHQRIIL